MDLMINLGSGPTIDNGFELAKRNMEVFIEDSKIPLFIKSYEETAEDKGRYRFILATELRPDMFWEVLMPSLPLEQVRYMDLEGQHIGSFYRIYVDGGSWIWLYGLINELNGIVSELN
ncbi:hypothetical protein ASF12_23300 [Paenibacillus sp. Leaf72]|nr:hypothetical protein ASF12_23300 [Paenibacillus sp. Leaf72]